MDSFLAPPPGPSFHSSPRSNMGPSTSCCFASFPTKVRFSSKMLVPPFPFFKPEVGVTREDFSQSPLRFLLVPASGLHRASLTEFLFCPSPFACFPPFLVLSHVPRGTTVPFYLAPSFFSFGSLFPLNAQRGFDRNILFPPR